MRYSRFEKINGRYWIRSFFYIATITTFLISGVWNSEISFVIDLGILGFIIVYIYSIIYQITEEFLVTDSEMIIFHGRKRKNIMLPNDMTLVITQADVRPLFSTHIWHKNQTIIIKNQYAVTLLKHISANKLMEILYSDYRTDYTMSTVEFAVKGYQYIYSFVYREEIIEYILQHHRCNFVIPKSIYDEFSMDSILKKKYIELYVDLSS